MNESLRVLSICSGIGGFDLACEWAGFQIVGQIENNTFCQMLLKQHFPDVPLLGDLKEVSTYEKEELTEIFGRVDILVGGIPCQPFSSAGKRRGTADDRHLWPYAFALIEKLQPCWVVIENVRNFTTLALDLVLSDLESLHYTTQAFVFPIAAVGAPHIRERCFILAHNSSFRSGTWRPQSEKQQRQSHIDSNGQTILSNTDSNRCGQRAIQYEFGAKCTTAAHIGNDGKETIVPNPDFQGLEVRERFRANTQPQFQTTERIYNSPSRRNFTTESRMGRIIYGISSRLDAARWPAGPGSQEEWEPSRTITGRIKWRRERIAALGNTLSPYQVYPFVQLIAETESEK